MEECFIYLLCFFVGIIFLFGLIFLELKIEGLLIENPFLKVSDVSYNLTTKTVHDVSYVDYQIGNKVQYNDVSYSINDPSILPLTKYNTNFNVVYYDTNNYDVQYHDASNILIDKYKMGDSGTWVKNSSGKLEFIKWVEIPKYTTYYTPGTLVYGPSNYVPSYEDTVYFTYNKNSAKK